MQTNTHETQSLSPDPALQQLCEEMGQMLQLDEPVSSTVLQAAVKDEVYARNLLTARGNAPLLKILMAKAQTPPTTSGPRSFSTLNLAGKAAAALLRWGKTGFSVTDSSTRSLRLQACLSCPNLTEAPDQLAYKLMPESMTNGVCKLCGCSIKAKVRLPSERCPDRDPNNPEKTRWGQPWSDSQ